MWAPARILRTVLLAGVLVAAIAVWLAARQPSPGAAIGSSDGVVSVLVDGRWASPVEVQQGQRRIKIEARDIIKDSDLVAVPAELRRFHDRQTELAAMLKSPGAKLIVADAPRPILNARGVFRIPGSFWAIMLPGIVGLILSAVVLTADPRASANQLVGGTGILFQLLTAAAAITHSRGIALDGDLYRSLASTNELSSTTFGLAMVILFCIYPRRLLSPRLLWAGFFVGLTYSAMIAVGRWLTWTASPDVGLAGLLVRLEGVTGGSQMIVSVEFAALCIAIGAQYCATRRDPVARAALLWFGLSVVLGAGGFIVLAILPDLLGLPAAADGAVAFPMFLFIYAGLAFGMLRYRLFEAKRWSFRILFAASATILLWIVDAAMIYGLGIDQGPALGLSIVLVGLLYLPARAALATRLLKRRRISDNELFAAAIDVAFAAPAARALRWRLLMKRLFDPLEITPEDVGDLAIAEIAEDGVVLRVPGPAGAPGLRLAHPGRGSRLFSLEEKALVDQLAALRRQAADALRSYDRGAADERRRMAQDLHDDIGARLLSAIHIAQGPVRSLLQDALRDIRTLVTGLIGESAPLSRVVADIRHETALRLEAAEIGLDWPILSLADGGVLLPYTHCKAITSVIREAVTNVLRHADARCVFVRVEIRESVGVVEIEDDGRGIPADTVHGTGLKGMATRLEGIGGSLEVGRGSVGARLSFDWPLEPAFPGHSTATQEAGYA